MKKIEELREYYDTHDIGDELEHGQWETDTVEDPMITTSLRLPKSLLDWVREQASDEHMKPTAWIRALIEKTRDGGQGLEDRVRALEAALTALMAQDKPVVNVAQAPATPKLSSRQEPTPFRAAVKKARSSGLGMQTGRPNPATRTAAAAARITRGARSAALYQPAVTNRSKRSGKS